MRCLACEIHLICRVVLRFNREAVLAGRNAKTLNKIEKAYTQWSPQLRNTRVNFAVLEAETPHLTTKSTTGAVYVLIIDKHLPNAQKRTIDHFVKGIRELIDGDDLDEGFIEVNEVSDVVDLLNLAKGDERRATQFSSCSIATTFSTTSLGMSKW